MLGSLSQARLKLQKATLKSDLESTEDDDSYLNKRLHTREVKSLPTFTEDKAVNVSHAMPSSCSRFKDYISGTYTYSKLIYKYIFIK